MELVIDDIPNAKNMAREPEKHFFPQQSLVVHQTSAFYIVANPGRRPTIQIVLSQLVRANHKMTVFYRTYDRTFEFRYIV